MKKPQIDPSAYIHPSAVLIGDVRVGRNVIVCPGVVLRADEGSPIVIGEGSNVQDGVIMHCLKGSSIEIGRACSITHGAVVHGPCVIGSETFVGFNAVIYKATVGEGSFISHCALVSNVELPKATLVPAGKMLQSQEDAQGLPAAGSKEKEFNKEVLCVNKELCQGYKRQE